jgi:hypothetical protein
LSETIHNIKINFEATGIDGSIRNTQRLLYTMNSLRIVVRDLQDVMAKPTLENVMFLAIQLTQLYSQLYRLINATNREMGVSAGLGVGRGLSKAASAYMGSTWATPTGDPSFGISAATTAGGARIGLFSRIGMMATAHPYVAAAVVAGTVLVGLGLYSHQQRVQQDEYMTRMREIAKSQGLEV